MTGIGFAADHTLEPAVDTGAYRGVELESDVTVLFGRNAAGKSVLLEAAAFAAAPNGIETFAGDDGRFVLIRTLDGAQDYWYGLSASFDYIGEFFRSDTSCLWTKDLGGGATGLELNGKQKKAWPRHVTFLHDGGAELPNEAVGTRRLLLGVRLVRAGLPRYGGRERVLFTRRSQRAGHLRAGEAVASWACDTDDERVRQLGNRLCDWADHDAPERREFEAVCRRIGIDGDLAFERRDDSAAFADIAVLTAGGVNLGYHSDGTLRIYEIVASLVDPEATVVLIDEPETGVHPGLLRRLLAEFETYASEKQIVLATHSPEVVSWANPKSLRLVTWQDDHPVARQLTEDEQRRVVAYLEDDGDLADFVYRGGLDES
ncbi:MAG: ATP-binding protein [Deltaproteobacteria bacterium]|nr:ATP-binding protein [Deltaproteobacteria bacterium]